MGQMTFQHDREANMGNFLAKTNKHQQITAKTLQNNRSEKNCKI